MSFGRAGCSWKCFRWLDGSAPLISFAYGISRPKDFEQKGVWLLDKRPSAMNAGVTLCAERNQVLLGVVARVAAILPMMDFQVRHGAALLASPTIAAQHLLP